LAQVSALDYAKAPERNAAAFCRQGFGTLLARLAEGVPVQLTTPATAIDWRQNIAVETPKGTITARAVIVTASTGVIGSGRIKFTPDLPKPQLDACNRLSLGSYDHIALELVGNPLGLQSDDLVFEKSNDARTAAILGNISGTPLCLVEVAGAFGRELSAKGKAAMVDFAATWLAGLYGPEVKKAIKRVQATRWNDDPWTLGASSAAATGGQGARRVLMEPVRDAIWFAGEAVHETLWGTVGGAWESGERAADAALHRLSALKEAAPAKREPAPKGKRKPRRERVHAAPRRGREAFPSIMRDESR
jgi:monoamine oxidase